MHSFKGRESPRCCFLTRLTGETKELLESEVKPLVEQFMRERGLELSSEKTVITHIENGFDFLGQNVRK
jgi:RNA-directed DNA polymerase